MQYDEGTHEKLYELIKLRGWNFGPEEMNNLVGKEWDEYFRAEQTEWYTNQIRAKNPTAREEYLRTYVELTHPNEDEYIHVLASFLRVPEHDYPKLREELANLPTARNWMNLSESREGIRRLRRSKCGEALLRRLA